MSLRGDRLSQLDRLRTEFDGSAYWQGRSEVFDIDALVTTQDGNRWNDRGQPTVYLTGDPGLTLIEAGRHIGGSADGGIDGVVWALRVEVADILDLRRADVCKALGLDEPYWFLDRVGCQGLVGALRGTGACAGILTQSAGLPDVPDRWNLVLFADRLSRPLSDIVSRPERLGSFRLAVSVPSGA